MNIESFTFQVGDHGPGTSWSVRVVTKNGTPWFVAKDVASVLGYRDADKLVRNLDQDEKGTQIVGTPGGQQSLLIINESGLYAAILRSRREEAKAFRKWVTGTVLPSIRKHRGYVCGQDALPAELVERLHQTIQANALPALRRYDKLTAHDHWLPPSKRQARSELAVQEIALTYDLPYSVAKRLTAQGLSAIRQHPPQVLDIR